MIISIDKEYTFIPDWQGNKDDDEPIKVTCKYLNPAERDRCIEMDFISQDNKPTVRIKALKDKYVKLAVTKIENLKLNDGSFVKDSATLMKTPGLGGIYNVIADYIIEQESGIDKKK
jgi:hypothetical protein